MSQIFRTLIVATTVVMLLGCDRTYLDTSPELRDPWGSEKSKGAQIYASCAGCHFLDGSGREDGMIPRIAGQHASVLQQKMFDLKNGTTTLPVMLAFAKSLSVQEITTVSNYIADLPEPETIGTGPGENTHRGEIQYATTCAGCHDSGNSPTIPEICGQHYGYIIRRSKEIETNARGDANPAMAAVVSALPATDMSAIADYLSRKSCNSIAVKP